MNRSGFAITLSLLCTLACAGNGTGKAQVFLAAEDTIPDGLAAGPGADQIQDGWTVEYGKFLLTIGNFRASRSAEPSDRIAEPRLVVLDMKNLPTDGFVYATFDDITAARWDKVGFDLANTSATAEKADVTSQADVDLMRAGGYSVYFEATLRKPDGRSCRPTAPTDCVARTEHSVRWGLAAGTSFDDCAPATGDAGFAVPTNAAVQIKPTIHGDHWFFSDLTQGAELTKRLAQWMVDSDLDRDGETTTAELKQVRASDVLRSPTYNLTGALIPITTAYDYLEAQARTLGDFQGEGECPTRRVLP